MTAALGTFRTRSKILNANTFQRAVIALLLAGGLAGCAGGATTVRSTHLPDVLEEVRDQPEKRLSGERACERSITHRPSDFPFKLFFAGLFEVEEEKSAAAFCAAIIEGVIAGDLSEEALDEFKRPAAERGMAPLGNLLRELIVAHERLSAAQTQAPDQL